jgi:hypothetical protein
VALGGIGNRRSAIVAGEIHFIAWGDQRHLLLLRKGRRIPIVAANEAVRWPQEAGL